MVFYTKDMLHWILNIRYRNSDHFLLLCVLFFVCVTIPVTKCTVLPAYIWPLSYIYNNTVPVTPPMVVHGEVAQIDNEGLSFDGKSGWIDAGDFTGQCISQPSFCKHGLSLGLRVKFNQDPHSSPMVIFDSGGHFGEGVSVFIQNGILYVEVGYANSLWQVSRSIIDSKWHFVLVTWSPQSGLLLFMDGPLVIASYQQKPMQKHDSIVNNRIAIGKSNSGPDNTYGKFMLEMVAVFNEFVPSGRVYMSYSYSPPGQPKGNVRYVNARFVNSATFDVRIFPDRGVKRESGYVVSKKSSTLLEFVLREGPLPYGMDFLVQQNGSDTVLQFHGKDWIHVDASDDSQVVAEVTVANNQISKMVFSTKGIIPNFFSKYEQKNQTTNLMKESASIITSPSSSTKINNLETLKTTNVDVLLSPHPVLETETIPTPTILSTTETTSTLVSKTSSTTESTSVAMATASTTLSAVNKILLEANMLTTTPSTTVKVATKPKQRKTTKKLSTESTAGHKGDATKINMKITQTITKTKPLPTYTPSTTVVISEAKPSTFAQTHNKTIKGMGGNIIDTGHLDAHEQGDGRADMLTINNPLKNFSSNGVGSLPAGNLSQIFNVANTKCTTCNTNKIVISSKENMNQSIVDQMKILSSIQGSINMSTGGITENEGVWTVQKIDASKAGLSTTPASSTNQSQSESSTTETTAIPEFTSTSETSHISPSTDSLSQSSTMTTTPMPTTIKTTKQTTLSATSTAETTQSTTSTVEMTQSTTSTAETTQSTTSTAETTQSTTSTAEMTQSTTSTAETTQSTSSTAETAQSTSSTTETMQSTSSTPELTQSTLSVAETTHSTSSTVLTTLSTALPIQSSTVLPISTVDQNNIQTGKTESGMNWQFKPGGNQISISQNGCLQIGSSHLCAPKPEVLTTVSALPLTAMLTTTTVPTTTSTTTLEKVTTKATTKRLSSALKLATKKLDLQTTMLPTTKMPPSNTKYITRPSPTNKIKSTQTTKAKPTKSKVHIKYPNPKLSTPAPQSCCPDQPGYVVNVFNVYQPPKTPLSQSKPSSIQPLPYIESNTDVIIGNVNKNKAVKPCVVPNCNPSVVGLNFNGMQPGQTGLSLLTPHPNGFNLQNHALDLNQVKTNLKFNNQVSVPQSYNQNKPDVLTAGYFQPYNKLLLNRPIYIQNKPVGYLQPNSYGNLGSPQVYNWKDRFLKAREKNSKTSAEVENNMMDDEMLTSLKDVSNGNLIYTSNNPKLDNISPSKLWRNSMLITINKGLPIMTSAHFVSGAEEQKEKILPIVGSTETLSGHRGMTFLLSDIENGVIVSAPQLQAHGMIHLWQGGLKFDGKTAWINADAIDAPFLFEPSKAKDGFAIGFKLMFDIGIQNVSDPKYLLDAGGVDGQGISMFIENGKLFTIVSMDNNMWQATSDLKVEEWMYLMVAWKQNEGLFIYINGMKTGENIAPTASKVNNVQKAITIGSNIKQEKTSFLLMYLSTVDIVKVFPDARELLEFAPPISTNSNILTFTSIDKDALQNHLKLKVHGDVKENRGALVFDGIHAFLHDTGEYADTFIMMPSLSPAGLTLTVKFKFNKGQLQAVDERFIVDTGGWLGHGISLFVYNGQLTAVVGSKGHVWVVQTTELGFTSWSFVVVTWRHDMGIYMYINGALVGKERSYKYLIEGYAPFDGLTFGCSILKGSTSFGKFQLAMTSFFPSYSSIDELMKFSPPLVLRPTFDWFFMMIQNGSTLTSPPLKVVGNIMSGEEGLMFDGKTGWLNAGSLEDSSEENSEIICEHYEKEIACPPGQVIKVAYANYGRTSEIPCQGKRKYIKTNCKAKNSFSKAKESCEGKRACRLKALNAFWGNTCPGVIKYIDIRYQCIGEAHKDGVKNFSGAHFLTNPSLSKKGLTLAIKIKLHEDTTLYTAPHFIVDSGGRQGNGVSIYTMTKSLFCEVSTNGITWKVSSPIITGDWLYILLTWSKEQGIVLYVNGVVKAVETHTADTLAKTNNTAADVLVIGKSSLNENNTFTRFQITSFTVLRTFISRSESFRMFSYYVGRSISNAFEVASMNQDTVLVCEYQTRTIFCPVDQVIDVVFANYGRTSSRPCAWGTHHETNCTLPNAIDIAREHCNGKNSCQLTAKNSMWKVNPCPGIIKYVEVKYICDEVGRTAVVKSRYVGNEDPNSLVIP